MNESRGSSGLQCHKEVFRVKWMQNREEFMILIIIYPFGRTEIAQKTGVIRPRVLRRLRLH